MFCFCFLSLLSLSPLLPALPHSGSLRGWVAMVTVLTDVLAGSVFSPAMFPVTEISRMASTLVETVSINYEDFNDSFLTCGTCLCMYNGQENAPKLLPCSHTVCRRCLEHIVQASSRDASTFRCPICRTTITIPRGGVTHFPASFIVNQLLDLMARQRRDIIPKCSVHPSQELMFCESCDTVFCITCAGGSHNGRGSSAHTVIPFSIAIKRMSEILLYKASLCMRNLNSASEVVSQETTRLELTADNCVEEVNKMFQDLLNLVDQRRHDVVTMVRRITEEKKRVLKEQLDIIEGEKSRVQSECQGLQHQMEVRNITKRISDLNDKLDVSSTLSEPRENAYMKFEYMHNSALMDLKNALNDFGQIKISNTFPALCTARLDRVTTHLKTMVTITTVDYHGNLRTTGNDPVVAELRNPDNTMVPLDLVDHDDGTYTVTFTPLTAGRHTLRVNIFDRPIKESPFLLDVSEHNNPVAKIGRRGSGNLEFIQPVIVAIESSEQQIVVLDTGNSRVKLLDRDRRFLRHISGHGLEQHSGTGMALTPDGTLVVINWRTKYVTEINADGQVVQKFTSPEFVEPISVAVTSSGNIIVADNGVGKLFVFTSQGEPYQQIGGKGDHDGQFKLISSVYCDRKDQILVCDNRLQVFTEGGRFLHQISAGRGTKGQFGGVTMDCHGNYLATRTEKGRSLVQVFNSNRQWLFDIDSYEDKLKRPSGLATTDDGHVYVVDLGNDCIKKFRYM